MLSALPLYPVKRHLPFSLAAGMVVSMAVAYTALDMLQPREPLQSLLAFLPGTISLCALVAAGLSRPELRLQLAPLSRRGAAALAVTTILLLPILGSSSAWIGWQWLPALLYAPASGMAQELYFRGSLLPMLERMLRGRKKTALVVHAVVFVAFHLRTFRALPSLPIALVVTGVLFLAGCGWGWQVQRDRTVLWAMLQHSLFLMLMSMFDWA